MNSLANDIFEGSATTETARTDVLLVGYGNPMRSDDAVGPLVASRVAALFPDASFCRLITDQQLLPEHTDEVAAVRRVLFIDASVNLPAGEVQISPITGEACPEHHLTHHVAPQTLLWMSQQFFGRAPRAWLIEIGVADLSVGSRLSPAVAKAAAKLVRQLAYYLRLTRSSSPVQPTPDQKECHHV
ncbi:MAG TPA: hydrogenase maturation protease [Phycisphaerae bacterium]|nr:hydrogenase maturation protease [Phycisphaerae bacterium]